MLKKLSFSRNIDKYGHDESDDDKINRHHVCVNYSVFLLATSGLAAALYSAADVAVGLQTLEHFCRHHIMRWISR